MQPVRNIPTSQRYKADKEGSEMRYRKEFWQVMYVMSVKIDLNKK